MELISQYSSGNLSAKVYKNKSVGHSVYVVECYESDRLVNQASYGDVKTANFVADNFTHPMLNERKLLNE